MIELFVALFLGLILFFITKMDPKEGMDNYAENIYYSEKIIAAIKEGLRDPRMTNSQLIELEDALAYATYIKNIPDI